MGIQTYFFRLVLIVSCIIFLHCSPSGGDSFEEDQVSNGSDKRPVEENEDVPGYDLGDGTKFSYEDSNGSVVLVGSEGAVISIDEIKHPLPATVDICFEYHADPNDKTILEAAQAAVEVDSKGAFKTDLERTFDEKTYVAIAITDKCGQIDDEAERIIAALFLDAIFDKVNEYLDEEDAKNEPIPLGPLNPIAKQTLGPVPIVVTGQNQTNSQALILDGFSDTTSVAPFASAQPGEGTVETAIGDINADGTLDLAFCSGINSPPRVSVVDGKTGETTSFDVDKNIPSGGCFLTIGKTLPDGPPKFFIGSGVGQTPYVYVFDNQHALINRFPVFSPANKGGVDIVVGNAVGDVEREIFVSSGPDYEGEVGVYKADGTPIFRAIAYSVGFSGGVNIAAGDIDGDGLDEIICGPGPGGGPHVRIIHVDTVNWPGDDEDAVHDPNEFVPLGNYQEASFFAFDSELRLGTGVGAIDTDKNGIDEILATHLMGGTPQTVRILNADGTTVRDIPIGEFDAGLKLSTPPK